MPDLLECCAALRGQVAQLDPALLSGEDCRRLVEELARSEKVFAAARARVAARAAECGAHRRAGIGDAAEWLARTTGSSVGEARSELKTAAAAGSCPATEQALRNGALSLAQAGEIARTEADCPGNEADLAELAATVGLAPLREEARRRRLATLDAEELAARQRAMRTWRHWIDSEGMVRFSGALDPRHGVRVMHRVEAEAERIHRRARRVGSTEPFEAHAADALVALLSGHGTASRGRAEVVFVCDLRAYRRGRAGGGEPCHIVGGGPVPVSVIDEELDDAFVKAVVHDGVRIGTVAHFGRRIPAHLRTALSLGSPPSFEGPVCVDCARSYRLEVDHVDPVANGGLTSKENLEFRCTPCHWEKTERDRAAGLLGNGGRARAAAMAQNPDGPP